MLFQLAKQITTIIFETNLHVSLWINDAYKQNGNKIHLSKYKSHVWNKIHSPNFIVSILKQKSASRDVSKEGYMNTLGNTICLNSSDQIQFQALKYTIFPFSFKKGDEYNPSPQNMHLLRTKIREEKRNREKVNSASLLAGSIFNKGFHILACY